MKQSDPVVEARVVGDADIAFPAHTDIPLAEPAELEPTSVMGKVRARVARVARRRSVQIICAFILIFAAMLRIEFGGPAILDNDGYYHIRWSSMLRQSLPHLPAFEWLPLTTLNAHDYVDHHFLFHVFLIPFTFGDLRVGAKIAAVLFSTVALTSLFWLLVANEVAYRWFWLAALVGSSEPFLYRMSMTRAPSLSLALLAIGAHLMLRNRWVWLGAIACVFVWLYSLFPLLLVFAAAYTLAVYMSDRRIMLKPFLSTVIGIAAGLVVNPYFPKNLILFKEHLFDKVAANYPVDVGVEWYPYDTWVILAGSAVAFGLFFAALFAFNFAESSRDIKPLFFLLISTLLLLLSFKSRRFIEYWPPVAVLFAAFTIGPKLRGKWTGRFTNTRDRAIAAIAAAVVVEVLAVGIMLNFGGARTDMATEPSPFAYQNACEWLKHNTPEGSMVFNTDWDDFPELFYYDTHNKYIAGLDPTYLYDRDHDDWKVYADVTLGNVEDPAPVIRDRFGAEYVFTSSEPTDFMQAAEDSGDFEKVYSDKYATILRVHKPGEPSRSKAEDSGGNNDGDDDDESGADQR
jgi:hypothetical protein